MSNRASKKSGLFGLFNREEELDPNERQPGQKLPAPKFDAPKKLDKRAISGNRVVCACSMQLPKVDPFNQLKIHRKGYLIFNTRGGAFYISQQFTDHTVTQLFNSGETGLIKNFKLHPRDSAEILLGDVHARFLYFTDTRPLPGMVLRFSNLSERQLEMLNSLTHQLPKIGESEKVFIANALKRRK